MRRFPLSIKQCRAVQAIADNGSFAAAAKALNIAQSAVSMQVASFEEALGVTLFDRSHRPPRLTPAGRTALAHARVIVEEYDRLLDAVAQEHSARGALRIGVIPTAQTNLLPAALMVLRSRANAPQLKITSALSGELVRAVDRGELDAALVHRPAEIAAGIAWVEIARQRIAVIAPPDSTGTELAALFARYPYIRFNRAAWVAPMIERRLAELGLVPEPGAEIQSIEAIRRLVANGFGVSILPVSGGDEPGCEVRHLAFGTQPLHRTIGFVMREGLARRQISAVMSGAFAEAAEALAEA